MKKSIPIFLVGASGRMGQAIKKVSREQDCKIVEAFDQAEVVIDISHADTTEQTCASCLTSGKPLVLGTTGQSAGQLCTIEKTAESIPLLLAPNFSVGVNVLFGLARKAAELLGNQFDLEIVEAHHRTKKDAPSGTAKRLAQVLADARGLAPEKIPTHAIRAGDIVGDHTVIFAGSGERLELTHKSSSRETFAHGALRGARWLVEKSPGLYRMDDVLGL